jgi:hypothetical protein
VSRLGRLRRRDERGQGLVEFSILVPAFLLILMGMLEFGFLFDHTLTIQYASREGARVGAALAAGGPSTPCATVDQYVVAAVNRILKSPGSRVDVSQVPSITIYKADSSGNQVGSNRNVWTLTQNAGPIVDGTTKLDFSADSGQQGWSACSRVNGATPDSVGVRLSYTYNFITPLGNVLRFFGGTGWSSLTISDKTVMALNPTN